jgi:hypothetical protein
MAAGGGLIGGANEPKRYIDQFLVQDIRYLIVIQPLHLIANGGNILFVHMCWCCDRFYLWTVHDKTNHSLQLTLITEDKIWLFKGILHPLIITPSHHHTIMMW